MENKQIHIQLILDIICPWCYLGHAHLMQALQQREAEYKIEIELKPYILHPQIPRGGTAKQDFVGPQKPGMGRLLMQEAKEVDIIIDYKKIHHIPNSLEAHRLLYLSQGEPGQLQLLDSIFQAYFSQGKNVEDPKILLDLAQRHEIPEAILEEFSSSDQGTAEVDALVQGYKEEYIRAVPVFVLNREHQIMGVQQSQAFVRYFDKLMKA